MSLRHTPFFLEFDDGDRQLDLSWAEFSVPNSGNRGLDFSWVELSIPDPDRKLEMSWVEFFFPDAARKLEMSFLELSVPDVPRALEASWFEFQVPGIPARLQASWFQMSIPNPSRGLDLSWIELSIPALNRALEMSWLELRLPGATTGPFGYAGDSALGVTVLDQSLNVTVVGDVDMGCTDQVSVIKQYSTLPVMRLRLTDPGGATPNFAGATGVANIKNIEMPGVVTLHATMQTDALGREYNCEYAWAAGDTELLGVGTHNAEIEVTPSGGGTARYPTDEDQHFFKVKVLRAAKA